MNSDTYLECNIPILTEVISTEDDSESTSNSEEILNETRVLPLECDTDPATSFEQLEATLRKNVLNELMTRIDFVLEHRVRDSLADVLQVAVDDLANNIRQGLSNSLEEVIQRAISQEISKMKSLGVKI